MTKPNTLCQPLEPDDVKVGMYVVVFAEKKEQIPPQQLEQQGVIATVMTMIPGQSRDDFIATGIPAKVIGISLPFLVVDPCMPSPVFATIDLRYYAIRRPAQAYVNVFIRQKEELMRAKSTKGLFSLNG